MNLTLEELSALAMDTIRGVVERVLAEDAESAEAAALVRSAHDVVAQLLHADGAAKQTRELDAASAQLLATLREELGSPQALGMPTPEEIEFQTRHTATVMMASWSEFLRRVLRKSTGPDLELDRSFLLPRRKEMPDDLLWQRLYQTLAPLGFGTDDASTIMRAVSEKMFEDDDLVRLPSGVELRLRPDGCVVARMGS